jgi:hypothetical protein
VGTPGGLCNQAEVAVVGAERDRVAGFGRLEDGLRQASDWYLWGPYVGEWQWGTVREDYSADRRGVGLPAARCRPSRAYRRGGWRGRVLRRGAAILDRGGQRWVAGPHLESGSCRGLLPPGRRLVVKARQEPVSELFVLAGPGDLTPHRLA